jgi:tetratricopeptide (TPR) repeat protein
MVLLAGLAALAFSCPAWAHRGVHERIELITRQIAAEASGAELYLRRGELHRIHGDWAAAESDYRTAAGLDPGLAAVHLARGTMFLEAGRPQEAIAALDHFLAMHPGHADAILARARALRRAGRNLEAAAEFTRAIEALGPGRSPRPEQYLERAAALEACADDCPEELLDEALRGLDEGIARLGPAVTLDLAALRLELRLGRHDAALRRIERAAARSPRKETWLLRRAEVLERAGRVEAAVAGYGRALEALQALPAQHRTARAASLLKQRARAALARLAGQPRDAEDLEEENGGDERGGT